jgi:hypothetical protein
VCGGRGRGPQDRTRMAKVWQESVGGERAEGVCVCVWLWRGEMDDVRLCVERDGKETKADGVRYDCVCEDVMI